MKNSIWANSAQMPTFPRLDGDLKTDVLVVGGGLAGLLCAHRLKQAGVQCALIEADRICGGVTRNTTAKITSQHGLIYAKLLKKFGQEQARFYWEANEAALGEYRHLAGEIPCDFEEKDSYVFSADQVLLLDEELSALDKLDIPAEFVREVPLPLPVAGAVKFSHQAQFHPLKFAAGIAQGLEIYEHTAAKEFAPNGVVTDRGTIRAEKIIIATHFPMLNKHGAYFLKLYQDRSYVLALEKAGQVDGMYLDAAKQGLSLRNQGDFLLLGGGGHRTGKKDGGWAELEQAEEAYFPKAREVCRWATQDCMSLDSVPYIGRYGGKTPDVYVAAGFNKWGMTSSMVSAMLLTDLVQGKESTWAGIFSPQRRMLRPQLLVNGWEASVNLLTPTKPRCPHLGCALKWNPQERSWDCPCHGSRFEETGKLLDGPATGDLEP